MDVHGDEQIGISAGPDEKEHDQFNVLFGFDEEEHKQVSTSAGPVEKEEHEQQNGRKIQIRDQHENKREDKSEDKRRDELRPATKLSGIRRRQRCKERTIKCIGFITPCDECNASRLAWRITVVHPHLFYHMV